jgi:molybdopterin-containing oxidoreductase family iron-sulfur binding subunit
MQGHIPIQPDDGLESAQRRAFLKVMAASMALAGAGCSGPPAEQILPYVAMPERLVPGQPLFYASAFVRRGYAQGILIETNMGRPTKVEGNPGHPASQGATDVFAQATVLQFWDPDRAQTVRQHGALSTWEAFEAAIAGQRRGWDADGGAGLRLLTGSVGSPTLIGQIAGLLKRYPHARWHSYDPLHDDGAMRAAQLAWGRPADTLLRFDRAGLVVCFDADVFGDWPGAVRYARDYMRRRRSQPQPFGNRLYAIEASPGLTGAIADNRLALPPQEIEILVWRLAARLGLSGMPAELPQATGVQAAQWETALARALTAHRGAALLVAGPSLSPQTRALVHLLNARFGNGATVLPIAPVLGGPIDHAQSLAALTAEMRAGAVSSLVIVGANPVYNAPADLRFADALGKVPFSAQLALYRDETGRRTDWHLPQTHDFEQWSDARAWDSTASIVQPAIAPLYDGRSAHQLLALLAGDREHNGHALVRRSWKAQAGNGFESFWQQALRRGLIEGSAAAPLRVTAARAVPPPEFRRDALVAVFAPDPSAGDGEYANNAWLQELPRPLTKLTWDNAALLGIATASQLGVESGDVLRLSSSALPGVEIEAPAWVLPGHADGAITLPLGYGRSAAGRVGDGVGFDAYRIRAQISGRLLAQKTGRRHEFVGTQGHATMEGRDIVRYAALEEFRRNPRFATDAERERVPEATLYPQWEYKDYKWGMAIDLNACIGCNACTIACQAENNIPVVGKEEVSRGREMHWIRVDRYYAGPATQPRILFQPVPCMHCETAPCEEVCPVGATVHDSEGLNVQVYNRCVGTRFCSNNCPYKVRRFNFLQYTHTALARPQEAANPEVTLRRRGVMEKCNYCLQRITRGRIEAEKLGRRIRDGEVVTACQAVCPTEAIVFGDLNDPDSRVNRAKQSPLDYALLAELNTRPRTTYAARVINADPALGGEEKKEDQA